MNFQAGKFQFALGFFLANTSQALPAQMCLCFKTMWFFPNRSSFFIHVRISKRHYQDKWIPVVEKDWGIESVNSMKTFRRGEVWSRKVQLQNLGSFGFDNENTNDEFRILPLWNWKFELVSMQILLGSCKRCWKSLKYRQWNFLKSWIESVESATCDHWQLLGTVPVWVWLDFYVKLRSSLRLEN